MFKLKNLPLTVSLVVVVSLIVGWGISMVLAWVDPTASPPSGNVAAPINVSGTAQYKTGIVGFSTSGYDPNYGLTVGNNATYGIKSDKQSWFGSNIYVAGKIGAGGTIYNGYFSMPDTNAWALDWANGWGIYWNTAGGAYCNAAGDTNRIAFVGGGACRQWFDLNNGNIGVNDIYAGVWGRYASELWNGSTVWANRNNATGGGLWISDDGGFYDYNIGPVDFRGSTGIRVLEWDGSWGDNSIRATYLCMRDDCRSSWPSVTESDTLQTVTNRGNVAYTDILFDVPGDAYIWFRDGSGIQIWNPEGTGNEVRLGAAWNKPGVYSNGNLYLGSEGAVIINDNNQENWGFDGDNFWSNGWGHIYTTSSNLHLDSYNGEMYLNYYYNNWVTVGNRDTGYLFIGNTQLYDDNDWFRIYSGANNRIYTNSYLRVDNGFEVNGRIYANEWIQFNNYTGLYSPNNGAHFYPNNASYGSWRVVGSRNGWQGLEFDAAGGNLSLMMGNTGQGWGSQTTGVHNNSYGWIWRFEHNNLYMGSGDIVEVDEICLDNGCRRDWPSGGGAETDTLQTVTDRGNTTNNWVRIPFIYDKDNAGYYLDPDETSNLWTLCLRGVCRGDWPSGGGAEADTLQSVTDRGNTTNNSVGIEGNLVVGGSGRFGGALKADGTIEAGNYIFSQGGVSARDNIVTGGSVEAVLNITAGDRLIGKLSRANCYWKSGAGGQVCDDGHYVAGLELSGIGGVSGVYCCGSSASPGFPPGGGGDPYDPCLAEGTKIKMADGAVKNIEDVKVGEKVLAYDAGQKKNIEQMVLKTSAHPDYKDGYYLIETESGHQLKATGNHPLYVGDNYRLTRDLRPLDTLYVLTDGTIAPTKIKSISFVSEPMPVYNLEIEINQNYFGNGILVHNLPKSP